MRARLTLIVGAAAILAVVGFHQGDPGLAASPDRASRSGQLAGQPAPDPALPAIVSAAVPTSSTAQTLLCGQGRRHSRPALVTTAGLQSTAGRNVATKPFAFPLLI